MSVSVNGACLTIRKVLPKNCFMVDIMPQTLKMTNLNVLKKHNLVNIELPLLRKDILSGYIVQGHVDGNAKIIQKIHRENSVRLTMRFPTPLFRFLIDKGSVTINGVLLTITQLHKNCGSVFLTPYTVEKTNLGLLQKGDTVNIEIDIIAKYLYKFLNKK